PTVGVLKAGGVPVTVGQMFTGSPTNLTYEPGAACDIASFVADGFTFTVTDTGSGPLLPMTTSGTIGITITPAIMFNGISFLSDHILRIGGTDNNDTITIDLSGSMLRAKLSTFTVLLPVSDVAEVRVYGRGGNDKITLNEAVP